MHHDLSRTDTAVNDPLPVSGVKGIANLIDNGTGGLRRQSPLMSDELTKAVTGDEFHRNVEETVFRHPEVVNYGYVRVFKTSRILDSSAKAVGRPRGCRTGVLEIKDFDRYLIFDPQTRGDVDDPGFASGDHRAQAVSALQHFPYELFGSLESGLFESLLWVITPAGIGRCVGWGRHGFKSRSAPRAVRKPFVVSLTAFLADHRFGPRERSFNASGRHPG